MKPITIMKKILIIISVVLLFPSCENTLDRGIAYYEKQNFDKAEKCFQKAANHGNVEAMAWIGLVRSIHYDNTYSEYYKKAIENGAIQWFFDMAEAGVPEVQSYLGYCYDTGIGVEKNVDKMLYWYQQAANKGIRQAQRNLAMKFLYGEVVGKNINKAIDLFLEAANQGDKYSQRMLGRIYSDGKELEPDNEKAIFWYAKAATQNDTDAQVSLGTLYLLSEDKKEMAYAWLKKAADAGDINAFANLGYCYATGTGVRQNIPEALVCFKKSAESGVMDSYQNYAVNAYSIWSSLSEEQKNYAEQCLSKAVSDGRNLAVKLKQYVDQVDSRFYTGSIQIYNKNDINTYSLPRDRYLATVEEYQTYLALKTNSRFSYSPSFDYCWITAYERNKYPNIFKMANPFSPSIAVDLGLRVKWAPYNIGANSPDELGDRFAWGETTPKKDYNWITYKYAKGSSDTFIPIGSNISGTQYDAATANWGHNWRMPTIAEYNELINRCSFEWVAEDTITGLRGLKVTGPNGNTLFFPCSTGLFGDAYYTSQDNCDMSISESDVSAFKISNSSYKISIYEPRYRGNYIRAVLVE